MNGTAADDLESTADTAEHVHSTARNGRERPPPPPPDASSRRYAGEGITVVRAQAWRNEFRGGGTRPWGPLRKRASGAKRAHKVYAKKKTA